LILFSHGRYIQLNYSLFVRIVAFCKGPCDLLSLLMSVFFPRGSLGGIFFLCIIITIHIFILHAIVEAYIVEASSARLRGVILVHETIQLIFAVFLVRGRQ
jgi:hypothetical protein